MNNTKTLFINRAKSFAWRIGMMIIAFLVSFAIDNLTQFGFSPQVTIVAGLLLGEISKLLNTKLTVQQ